MFWEALEAKWGILGPWEVQAEVAVIALNQIFLKFCVEGEGARQGSRLQCPVSTLLPWEEVSLLFFVNGRKYDLRRMWRPTTIHRYSLSHRLSDSLMTGVQNISNHIPQSKSIYRPM